jgi:hypothetical protein
MAVQEAARVRSFVITILVSVTGLCRFALYPAHGQTVSLHDFRSNTLLPAVPTGLAVNPTGIYVIACTLRGEGILRRLTDAAVEMWTRPLSGCARAIEADADGVYVVSQTSPEQAFLRKYATGGGELWMRTLTALTVPRDYAPIALTADSNGIYVGGPGFLRKYTSGGQELWLRELAGDVQGIVRAIPHAMAADDTSVYVVGRTLSSRSCESTRSMAKNNGLVTAC